MRFPAGTVVSRRALPGARVLAHSFLRHHPHGDGVTALLLDDREVQVDATEEPFEIVRPGDLGLSGDELERLTLLCDERGLAAALTPWLLRLLLDRGAPAVVYLASDATVLAPLDEVAALAEREGLVLVPSGAGDIGAVAYSTGLLGVGAEAGAFVDAWRAAFPATGVRHPPLGRWLEQSPARFPTVVLRDPAHQPVAFGSTGSLPEKPHAYGYGVLPDGSEIDDRMRRLYREELLEAERAGSPQPPTPFGAGGAEPFVRWLNDVVFPPAQPGVSRYLGALWRDGDDLRRLYPSLVGETVERYLEWVEVIGADERAVPLCVRPTPQLVEERRRARRRNRPSVPRPEGVNVVGWLDAVVGLGEVGRLLVAALRAAGTPVAPVSLPSLLSARLVSHESVPVAEAGYDVNLLCATAAETPGVADQLGAEFFAGRRTIGLWFWEAEEFTLEQRSALDLVDEVWVASEFTRAAIAAVSTKPVRLVPIPVAAPGAPAAPDRPALGLPADRHVFLSAYDFLSTPERKNPTGMVEAFTRAFAPDEGPVLVLKSINGDQRPAALAAVREAASGRPDVLVVDRYLPADEQVALLSACDTYVSLHRSEGYGLPLAEAMALGKPVVATGYSGNVTFMDDSVAYLVDYELAPIGPGRAPYPPEARWAEPDVGHAAELMRAVVEHPDEARVRAGRAAERIRTELSVERCGPALAAAVAAVRATPSAEGTWRPHFMWGWRREPHPGVVRRYEYDWLPDGTPVDDAIHRLLASGAGAPDPDLPGGSRALVAWLDAKVFPRGWPVISRYQYELWRTTPAISARFADPGLDPASFLHWLRREGREETDVPYQLLPDDDGLRRAEQISPGARTRPGPRARVFLAQRRLRRALTATRSERKPT